MGVEFEYCLDDILASANFEPDPREAHAAATLEKPTATAPARGQRYKRLTATATATPTTTASARLLPGTPSLREAADALRNEPPADRRKRRRALISAPVRVRGINVTDAVVDEISTTIDVLARRNPLSLDQPQLRARHGSGRDVSVQQRARRAARRTAGAHRPSARDVRWPLRCGRRAGRRRRRRYCRFVRTQDGGLVARATYAASAAGRAGCASNGSVFSLTREAEIRSARSCWWLTPTK